MRENESEKPIVEGEEKTQSDHSLQHVSARNEDSASIEEKRKSLSLAGFWMRFWAYLLDLIIIGSINRIIIYPIFRMLDVSIVGGGLTPIAIATLITYHLYFLLMTKYYRQTLGKMVFGLKVISLKEEKLTWGTVLFRELIGRYITSTGILHLLYILVAFSPKKQGIHDLIADTVVIREKTNDGKIVIEQPAV